VGSLSPRAMSPHDSITGQVPYFFQRPTEEAMLADVYSTLRWMNSLPVSQIERGAANRLPDGVVTFHDLRFGGDARGGGVRGGDARRGSSTGGGDDSGGDDGDGGSGSTGGDADPSMSYTFAVNDNLIAVYHRANNFSRLDVLASALDGVADQSAEHGGFDLENKLLLVDEARLALMDMMHAAFRAEVTGRSEDDPPEALRGVVPGYMWRALSMRYAQRMPFHAEYDVSTSMELFGAAIYPLALTMPLPVLLYLITLEKEERLRELQRSMGLKTSHHIIATGIYALTQYLINACVFGATGAVVGIRLFLGTGVTTLLALALGWGLCLVAVAFALSALLSSRQLASVTGFAVATFGNIVSFSVATVVYGDIPTLSGPREMPLGLFLIPQLALSRVVYLLNYNCVVMKQCSPGLQHPGLDREIRTGIGFLYLDAVLVMVIALYLERVMPSRYGVPSHPLFFLEGVPGLSWASQPGAWQRLAKQRRQLRAVGDAGR